MLSANWIPNAIECNHRWTKAACRREFRMRALHIYGNNVAFGHLTSHVPHAVRASSGHAMRNEFIFIDYNYSNLFIIYCYRFHKLVLNELNYCEWDCHGKCYRWNRNVYYYLSIWQPKRDPAFACLQKRAVERRQHSKFESRKRIILKFEWLNSIEYIFGFVRARLTHSILRRSVLPFNWTL